MRKINLRREVTSTLKLCIIDNQRKLIQQAPSYQEFLEELEKVVDAAEPEDTRTPLEMIEDWLDFVDEIIYIGKSNEDSLKELLATFKSRGVSFDN